VVVAVLVLALTMTLAEVPGSPDASPSSHRAAGSATQARVDPQRPNVVIVLTDDQRTDSLARMPRVQRLLADKGTWFPNAQVPTPLCCPSRASLLTGHYAHDTGVYSNGRPHGGWWAFQKRRQENRTIAVALRRAGYWTGLFGKYFNRFGNLAPPGYVPPGWDRFLAFRTRFSSGAYYRYRLSDGSFHGTGPEDYSTDVLARAADRFVRTAPPGRPLFLLFAPYAPHAPYLPAPRHDGAWAGLLPAYRPASVTSGVQDKSTWLRRRAVPVPLSAIDTTRARQQESLMAVDEAVAGLVGALRDTGRMRNTLFVYTSDNGLLLGDHHLLNKGAPYAPALSVPLLVRWDGRVPAGHVDRRLALNIDVTRTITAVTPASLDTDGVNVLGSRHRDGFLLEGARGPMLDRPAFCGWRTAVWTYVRWATGEEELYSDKLDPHQVRNLARTDGHRHELLTLRERTRRHCVPEPPGFDW
jgi:arylsulfatase A-like enzyme